MTDPSDDLPWSPSEKNVQLALGHTYDLLRKVDRKLDQVERKLDRLRPKIPLDRLYTYEEAGVRIIKGKDPDEVTKEDWGDCLSAASVRRLVADDEGLLEKTKIGRMVYVSEVSIREYKQAEANGQLPNYQKKYPRNTS